MCCPLHKIKQFMYPLDQGQERALNFCEVIVVSQDQIRKKCSLHRLQIGKGYSLLWRVPSRPISSMSHERSSPLNFQKFPLLLTNMICAWEEYAATDHLAHDAAHRPNVNVLLVAHP